MGSIKSLISNAGEPHRSVAQRYLIAVAAVTTGTLARLALTPAVGPTAVPFIFLYPAVAAAGWYGGLGPALFSIVLAIILSIWFFIEPLHRLTVHTVQDAASLLAFILGSLFICVAMQAMHRTRLRLAQEVVRRHETESERETAQHLLQTTLASIGDGVIVTDARGGVSFLNAEAERLTGWTTAEASGQPMSEVFKILDENTRQPAENPVERVLAVGSVVGLANHTILVTRDGQEIPIDDSAAPIREGAGPVLGIVLVFRDVREHRSADLARTRLAAIVEYSGDAIITKDLNGIVQTWNASAQRILGYRPEEIVGQSIKLLIPPERMEEETQILKRLREGLPYERVETIRVAKDGRRLNVSISVSPLKNSEGQVIGASKVLHDITEMVAARHALSRERELLATTLRSIGDGVIVTDIECRIKSLNHEAEKLTGWTQAEASGLPLENVFRILNEDTRDEVENPVLKVLRSGAVAGLANHTLLVSKEGTERPIDDSAAPIRHLDGSVSGVVLVFRDFTVRRLAERTLRESEERFRVMANAAPVMIWVTGSDKLRTWFNKTWLDFVGRSMEQELGNGWSENVHPDDFDRCLRTYTSAFDACKPFSMTYRLKRNDDEYRWMLDSGIPRYGVDKLFAGYIGSCFDITERQRAEEALQQEARRKDEFLAILSHELRNPLAPVRMAVALLKKVDATQPELEHLREIIDRQTSQLTRLLDDLLDVSRISSGKISLRKDCLDICIAVSDAVESIRPQVNSRRHDLIVHMPDDAIYVDGDVTRLSQVFVNLLANAVRYTERGGRIEVTVRREGDDAVVRVKDSGIGIRHDQLSHIFEMFAQVDQSLERGQGGLGVGLALARTLVELHGGHIEANSEGLGNGSEFIVRIPALATESRAASKVHSKPEQARRPRRIVVADDNVDSAEFLAALLRSEGHDVYTVNDGATAVETVLSRRPDLAILDIGMPRLNGYDAARKIRSGEAGRVLLIAVTGWGQEEDKRRSSEAGFDHHLTKPVDLSALTQILGQLP